jgi:hypothetical protein
MLPPSEWQKLAADFPSFKKYILVESLTAVFAKDERKVIGDLLSS